MKEYQFEWANGTETVKGRNVEEACGKIKTNPQDIITGFLVRIRNTTGFGKDNVWRYWDAEMFWKHLKKNKLKKI